MMLKGRLKRLEELPRFMVVESGFDKDTIDESIIEKAPCLGFRVLGI